MADKEKKPKSPGNSKRSYYKVEGDRIVRTKRNCPKCGPGVFLAQHEDRLSCGRCGYTEFTKE